MSAESTRVQHAGPHNKFCVLCQSGEHERVDEPVLPPTLAALRDAIADPRPIDLPEALASARTLLAAHTRELAEAVDGLAAPDCSDMNDLDDAWECGNTDTAAELRRYADRLDAQTAGGDTP